MAYLSRPPRPRSASIASSGVNGLSTTSSQPPRPRPASTAMFGLKRPYPGLKRPYPGLNGLILASTTTSNLHGHVWPQRPHPTSTALTRPLQPRLGLKGLILASKATFGLNGFIRPQRPKHGLISTSTTLSRLQRPQRPYPGLNGLIPALSRPQRPLLISLASFRPQRLYPGLNDLIPASTTNFHLNGKVYIINFVIFLA